MKYLGKNKKRASESPKATESGLMASQRTNSNPLPRGRGLGVGDKKYI